MELYMKTKHNLLFFSLLFTSLGTAAEQQITEWVGAIKPILTQTSDDKYGHSNEYFETHRKRYISTLTCLQDTLAQPTEKSIVEIGYTNDLFRLFLQDQCRVTGQFFSIGGDPSSGEIVEHPDDHSALRHLSTHAVDIQKNRLPYADGSQDLVIFLEVLEHMPTDPMFVMGEINRVLKIGGQLLISTPNICSLRSVLGILHGYTPYLHNKFMKSGSSDRHNLEYAPHDFLKVLTDGGFSITKFTTFSPYNHSHIPPESLLDLTRKLVSIGFADMALRGDVLMAMAQKQSNDFVRFPAVLYE